MPGETMLGLWSAAITEAGGLGDACALREVLAEEAAVKRNRRRRRRGRRWRLAIPRLGCIDIVWRPAASQVG